MSFRPSASAWRNLVVRSAVLYISGFLDYARNDSKYTLEITKEKSKPKYNRLAFSMSFFNSQKYLPSKDFWEKGAIALRSCRLHSKRLTCFAYCDAVMRKFFTFEFKPVYSTFFKGVEAFKNRGIPKRFLFAKRF